MLPRLDRPVVARFAACGLYDFRNSSGSLASAMLALEQFADYSHRLKKHVPRRYVPLVSSAMHREGPSPEVVALWPPQKFFRVA
jgi:hypothetical protein